MKNTKKKKTLNANHSPSREIKFLVYSILFRFLHSLFEIESKWIDNDSLVPNVTNCYKGNKGDDRRNDRRDLLAPGFPICTGILS